MKKKIFALVIALTFVLAGFSACKGAGNNSQSSSQGTSPATASVKVMSINIAGQDMTTSEYVTTVKYSGQTGHDYTYTKRRARLDALISNYEPDVLFLQEVNGSNWWWPYLVTNEDSFVNTFTDYTLVGRTNRVGQSDGGGSWWGDLYNQLYYNKNKFEAVATGMFYLNSKRDVPFSKSWHESAAYSSDDNNTCVWAVLKDKKTGVSAVYASTHLKPVGSFLARKLTNYRQAVNLAEGLYELSVKYADEGGNLPIAVGGDFNANTATPFNKSYAHLTEHAHYSDAQKVAAKTDKRGTARVWGKNRTLSGEDGTISDGTRIDMFFTQGMTVSKYQCIDGTYIEDVSGVYYMPERIFDGTAYDLSDHLPIMMDVKIPLENREIKAPSGKFRSEVGEEDVVLPGGTSEVEQKKITFSGADILKYFGESQYLKADIVENETYGGVLRLMATESCPNLFTYFDYDALMRDKGLTAADIENFTKIKITLKTSFVVENSELMVALLNEGDSAIGYGKNTTSFVAPKNFAEKTVDIVKTKNASGGITDIVIGTMAYSDDYSGTCGMFAGDCVYIKSIEFIA
ncbi:MAG: endonuclease/exonuclease/phosphatase family protein [Clostridia bacterium]|nr:endonuclease/exonuclease/phosphatase family protein [Clostridia bacterium]